MIIDKTTLINPKVILLMGPTASGKTLLALELFKALPIDIISVDSALIYRGMDIGTAKPLPEELLAVPHRLVNILDPTESYSAANFRRDALIEIEKSVNLGRIPVLVGGTMLYFKALLEGLSPLPSANSIIREQIVQKAKKVGWGELHKELMLIDINAALKIHPNDPQRLIRALEVFFISGKTLTELTQEKESKLPYQFLQFAIAPKNREILHKKIEQRFNKMLKNGFENEVRMLLLKWNLHEDLPSMRCVGYRQMYAYIQGNIGYDEMVYRGICATRQLAKRQMTWLNGWENLIWLDGDQPKCAFNRIMQFIITA